MTRSSRQAFSGVQLNFYWSSTSVALNTDFAWGVFVDIGDVNNVLKIGTNRAWLVRGGQ